MSGNGVQPVKLHFAFGFAGIRYGDASSRDRLRTPPRVKKPQPAKNFSYRASAVARNAASYAASSKSTLRFEFRDRRDARRFDARWTGHPNRPNREEEIAALWNRRSSLFELYAKCFFVRRVFGDDDLDDARFTRQRSQIGRETTLATSVRFSSTWYRVHWKRSIEIQLLSRRAHVSRSFHVRKISEAPRFQIVGKFFRSEHRRNEFDGSTRSSISQMLLISSKGEVIDQVRSR